MSRRRRRNNRSTAPAPVVPQGQAAIDATEQLVERQLTPDTREVYLKIVVAGMKAGLENGPNSILAGLQKSKDPVADCAKGAIGLVLILKHQSKGIMPVKAMVPAAMTLMLKALSFADRTGIVKVGPDELARATHIFANLFLAKFGITPQMMQTAMTKVQGLTQDPVAMEQMKRASGVVRHPMASSPTPLPEGDA
jgi:hypothetical protein